MKKIKCFIACAFGKEDVDSIYENAIVPVLEVLGIEPLRVDRVEHNENIDQKIIKLIKECDFCISDLTYSRQSVYYESGYIHGLNKEVIFCVRKDHFTPKSDDENGIYKVHFDLQTKNIIDWSSTKNTLTFKKRLTSRITIIIKPLLEENEKKQIIQKNRDAFQLHSISQRLGVFHMKFYDVMKTNNYIAYSKLREEVKTNKENVKYYIKGKTIVMSFYYNSCTIKELRDDFSGYIGQIANFEEYTKYLILNTIKKIPIQRIEDAYPNSTIIVPGKCIKRKNAVGQYIYMYFIGGYQSSQEYNDAIIQLTSEIKKTST